VDGRPGAGCPEQPPTVAITAAAATPAASAAGRRPLDLIASPPLADGYRAAAASSGTK
jgi:hypothetical protein